MVKQVDYDTVPDTSAAVSTLPSGGSETSVAVQRTKTPNGDVLKGIFRDDIVIVMSVSALKFGIPETYMFIQSQIKPFAGCVATPFAFSSMTVTSVLVVTVVL